MCVCTNAEIQSVEYIFVVWVYMVSGLTTRVSSLGQSNSPSVRSHYLLEALHLDLKLTKFFPFHVTISFHIVIVHVLFM